MSFAELVELHFALGGVKDKPTAVNSMDIWYREGDRKIAQALNVVQKIFENDKGKIRYYR